MIFEDGYLIFDIWDRNKINFNTNIISDRDNGIKVYYYFTEKEDIINTNVKIMKNECLIYEYNVVEKLFDINLIKKILNKYNFKIIKITPLKGVFGNVGAFGNLDV